MAVKTWFPPLAQPAIEFAETPLSVISGAIPPALNGTLYRNGAGRLQRGGRPVGHWFDGDGAILAVHFAAGNASATYRYVKTSGYLQEEQRDRFLFANYGMTAPGFIWNNWIRPIKNAANTSVLALPDKLLALWEGACPHALDRRDLTTIGLDNLEGLQPQDTYSAHPKVDPHSGEIYNFGITLGAKISLNLYKSDATGKVIQRNAIALDSAPALHDWVLAGRYLVFFIPPVRINLLAVLSGLVPFGDAMEWKPKIGTQIFVIDRDTLTLVSRGEANPWYQWHFANGCEEDDGTIAIELARYDDFRTNQYLREVASGNTHTVARSTLWRVRLNPQTGIPISLDELSDRHCEFPIVEPQTVGQPWRYTYLNAHRDGADPVQDVFNAIALYDRTTETMTVTDLGAQRYPSEPIFAPHDGDRGWLLSVVYDGQLDESQVWIYDRDRLDDEPVCRLQLPEVIPHSFHGTWRSS